MTEPVVEIANGIATITLNRPKTFNALTSADYDGLANALRKIDKDDDVVATIWQAYGEWFCSGTDVQASKAILTTSSADRATVRGSFLSRVAHTTTDCGQALASHRKILVAALNGPVMGIAAAFLGHFDFVYSMPNAWLSTPFTFLGIVAEGGASANFVNRMGIAKANESLIFGQRMGAQELLDCGFINKIFPLQSTDAFHKTIQKHLMEQLSGLDPEAVLGVKKLLQATLRDRGDPDAVNFRESYAQAERFASGVPGVRFRKIAAKEIRHKL
ncbi:ClpP crotonase [Pluteus cervinus]|uniref:ClpP crotonase n=1 Tax=Pluteus cervinus TaxID=181527 RepID=A0ACD3BHJ1_9AGAR|nr:ClpP crotonase [Pluteus cervinus]